MVTGPLGGVVVGVTADRRWREQADLLERRGATVVHAPTVATAFLVDDERLRAATEAVVADPPAYLVATTGMGMRAWLQTAAHWDLGTRLREALAAHTRIVARGPKAAAALAEAGLAVWQRSPNEQMGPIADILAAEPLAGRTVAVQEYGLSNEPFNAAVARAGARVVAIPVYQWRVPDDTGPARDLVSAACRGAVGAVTFTSAPAVHNLFAIAGESAVDLRAAFNTSVVAACVGPVCASAAYQEGVLDPLAPEVGRLGLLVRALSDRFRQQDTGGC